ncbi:MAG TPA: O-antigen ligase family protein [Candidatus Eisenbacteria bacterium]|jgi:hypothetical protein
MALIDRAAPPRRVGVWVPVALAVGSVVAVTVWAGLGLLSLQGVALLAIAAPLGLLFTLYSIPQSLVVLAPALMPLPLVSVIFPHEIAFGLLTGVLLLQGFHHRASWIGRLETLELANLAFVGWALFSVFWCNETILYLLGARRLIVGWASFWVAYRIARLVPRRWYELGLVAGAISLALSALAVRLSGGFSEAQLRTNRAAATDLGWGTANYIATILLVLSPLILDLAFRARERWLKWLAWPCLSLIALMQTIIASRAATILFIGGTLVQVSGRRARGRWLAVVGVALALAGLLATPFGQGFLARFTSPRELGSMVIRIWFFRDAWRRVTDNLPWGMGLDQGWVYPDHLAYNDPHNYWLAVGSELGVLGVLGWFLVLVLLWRRISTVVSTPGWDYEGRALQIAFLVSQLHTLVEPTFQGPHYQFVYFWVMGGYLGYHALHLERGTPSRVYAPASSER